MLNLVVNANNAAAASPVAPGGVPGHDRFGPPSISAWQNKIDGSPAPVGIDFTGYDDPNLKPPLKDFSQHQYQTDFTRVSSNNTNQTLLPFYRKFQTPSLFSTTNCQKLDHQQ